MPKLMRKYSFLSTFFLLISIFAMQSCQHKPVVKQAPQALYNKSKVKSKIQIKNLKNGKVDYVTADALVEDSRKLRMEIRAAFGVLAAVIVFRQNEFEFWIPMKNKAGRGTLSAQAVQKALGVSLDPQIFYVVMGDADFRDRNWKCNKDPYGFKSECFNAILQANIKWQSREGMKKKILITSPSSEMTWIVDSVEEFKEFKDSDFIIKWGQDTVVEQF